MNNKKTFNEIYDEHVAAVFRFCLRAVSRREIAEELTSEVFLALHKQWSEVPHEQLPGWLFTVAKRRGADYWRRRYVEERWEPEFQQNCDLWSEPEHSLEELLTRCTSLKPVHRVCLTLRFAQGMSRSEIAREMNLTELQVKGHLQYSLQLLRQYIRPKGSEQEGERHVATDTGF